MNDIKFRHEDKSGEFTRKLSDKYPVLYWDKHDREYKPKCHWGQLKLFYSELEFLTKVSKYYNLDDCVVVYVGSANGAHLNILTKFYPKLKWILYDPNKFLIEKKHIKEGIFEINTGKNGFFTDETVNQVLKKTKNKKILFISDIRADTDDVSIMKNMYQQQKWAIQMNSVMIMMKFRQPFNTNIDLNYNTDDIKDKIKIIDQKKNENCFLYLSGTIQIQVYPPIYSTETRLIAKINNEGKYELKYYDSQEYEGRMLYFNEYVRMQKHRYKDSHLVKYHIIGFDDSYENVSEYYIIEKYLKSCNKKHKFENILYVLNYIHNNMAKITNKNLFNCQYLTHIKYIESKEEKNTPIDKYKTNINILYRKIYDNLNRYYIVMKNNLKNPILDKNHYKNQIKLIDKYKKYINQKIINKK